MPSAAAAHTSCLMRLNTKYFGPRVLFSFLIRAAHKRTDSSNIPQHISQEGKQFSVIEIRRRNISSRSQLIFEEEKKLSVRTYLLYKWETERIY